MGTKYARITFKIYYSCAPAGVPTAAWLFIQELSSWSRVAPTDERPYDERPYYDIKPGGPATTCASIMKSIAQLNIKLPWVDKVGSSKGCAIVQKEPLVGSIHNVKCH